MVETRKNVNVTIDSPERPYFPNPNAKVMLMELRKLLHDEDITKRDLIVLIEIMLMAPTRNVLKATHEEIAQQCGVGRSHVSEANSKFMKRGIIRWIRNGLYLVSPLFSWRDENDLYNRCVSMWKKRKDFSPPPSEWGKANPRPYKPKRKITPPEGEDPEATDD